MEPVSPVSFGDNVQVRRTPETEALGLADLRGQVYGETTPSVTGVPVIGSASEDYAINVSFDDREGEYWFAPHLLDLVDHGPGTEIRLEGVDKRWVRQASGEWLRLPGASPAAYRKPWWKFW